MSQQQPNYNDPRYAHPSAPYQGQVPQYGHQPYSYGAQQYPPVGYYPHGYPTQQYGTKSAPELYNSGPSPTVQGSSNQQSGEPVVEIQWIPHITSDAELVDKWFTELNKDGRGIVGGLEIATFLKRSNLPKESLRTIWSLIDNKNLGYVNKSQFNNIIRLVSISCSPIYMGSPPSLERLQKTLYDKIPLPAALSEVPESEKAPVAVTPPVETASVPAPTHPAPATTPSSGPNPSYSGYPPSYQHPGPHNTMPLAYPVQYHTGIPPQAMDTVHGNQADADDEFSDFASAAASDAGSQSGSAQPTGSIPTTTSIAANRLDAALDEINGPQWKPIENDREKIDKWFLDLDTAGTGMVGGLAIAMFLKRSNLPKESLRTIWSLVDSRNAGQVNKQQFTNIIRLVSISCSPIYMGSPPSMERFEKTLSSNIPLPASLLEEDKPAVAPATVDNAVESDLAEVPMQRSSSGLSTVSALSMGSIETSSVPQPPPVLPPTTKSAVLMQWIPNPIDASYIDKWFSELDREGKGLVGGMAVVMFLKRSHLSKDTLRAIWAMIDAARAGQVNKEQFTNMMRLVSIQCHPAYSALPPALERLQQTLNEYIPLPLSLVHAPAQEHAPCLTEQPEGSTSGTPVPAVDGSAGSESVPSGPSATDAVNGGAIQWIPSSDEQIIVDKWYTELDPEGKGSVGGMAVAMFLRKSNLPREALRAIWSLVDNQGAGQVDKKQFCNILRLVAIQWSPQYCHYAPSMECLRQTLTENIPLPASLLEEVAGADARPTQVPVTASSQVAAVPEVEKATPSEPSLGSNPNPEEKELQWIPSESDATLIDTWFAELDSAGTGSVGGLAIAMFLKRSNLPKESLRTIWSLVDSRNAGQVNKQQFTNIIRLVSISCSPIYMGSPPSMERFEKTLKDEISLPYALVHNQETTPSSVEHIPARSVGTASSSMDHDEMDEFSGAPSGELSTAPALEKTLSLGTSRLSVFDELVENDLQAMDEEWEDFADSKPNEPIVEPMIEPIGPPDRSNSDLVQSEHVHVVSSMQGAALDIPVVEDVDEEEDFGSFDQFDNVSPAVPSVTVSANTEIAVESVGAALPLTELKTAAVDEDTFAPEVTADVDPLMTEAPLAVLASPPVETEEEDAFGIFDEADKDGITPIQSDVAASAIAVEEIKVIDETVTDSPPIAVDDVDPFGSLDRANDTPIRDLTEVTPIEEDEDAFGSFDEGDNNTTAAAASNEILSTESTKVAEEVSAPVDSPNEAEMDVSSNSKVEAKAPAGPVVATDFDPFGSLDRTEDVPLGGLTLQPEHPLSDELDEFGSFDEGDAPSQAVTQPVGVEPEQNQTIVDDLSMNQQEPSKLEINLPSVSNSEDQMQTAATGSGFDEEDEDFGDFETHSPVPSNMATQQQASTNSFFELSLPTSATMSQSISEVSLFDPPEDDLFMQDAFASQRTDSTAPAEVDLLDFLSDPTPIPASTTAVPVPTSTDHAFTSHSGSTKLGIAQPFEANFGDSFDTNTPLGHSPIPAAPQNSFPTIHSNAMLNDFFSQPDPDTDSTTPSQLSQQPTSVLPNTPQQQQLQAEASLPLAAAPKDSIDLENLVTRKPLSLHSLEQLTTILMNKHFYEHAYNCNEQYKLIKTIQELTKKKQIAVEEDDLETAMIIKKEILILQQQNYSIDQEFIWELYGNSTRKGENLLELIELLQNIDEKITEKFKLKFLIKNSINNNMSIEEECKYNIIAKRYSRMIMLTLTTHIEYTKQWLLVLQIVVKKVKEGNEIITNFKKLSEIDQTALISHLKMSEYALGLVAVSEIGMWVSASCIEAMVHESIAMEVYTVCQELLVEVDLLWGMGSRFKEVSMDALTLEAARLAENSNVQYCNFTLRPLSYEIYKRDGDKMRAERVKLYDNPLALADSHFMEVRTVADAFIYSGLY